MNTLHNYAAGLANTTELNTTKPLLTRLVSDTGMKSIWDTLSKKTDGSQK